MKPSHEAHIELKNRITDSILRYATIIGTIILIIGTIICIRINKIYHLVPVYITVISIFTTHFFRKKLSLQTKIITVIIALLIGTINGLRGFGFASFAKNIIVIIPVFAFFILSIRQTIYTFIASFSIYSLFAYLHINNFLHSKVDITLLPYNADSWFTDGFILLFMCISIISITKNYNSSLIKIINSLDQKNSELTHKNKELSSISSTLSLDLKTPSITVSDSIENINKYEQHFSDSISKKSIENLTEASQRIDSLIEDLTTYNHITNNNIKTESIDTQRIAEEAITELTKKYDNNPIDISFENRLPEITGNHESVRLLFLNIIDNAIKFQQADKNPIIRIKSIKNKKHWQFTIADNGIGIPASHREKVFSLFYRIHTRKLSKGNGIGLTLCKKIVDRHGGKIWIDQSEMNGTSVHFTLLAD